VRRTAIVKMIKDLNSEQAKQLLMGLNTQQAYAVVQGLNSKQTKNLFNELNEEQLSFLTDCCWQSQDEGKYRKRQQKREKNKKFCHTFFLLDIKVKNLGITRKKMAQLLGVSDRQIYNYKSGENLPTEDIRNKIADLNLKFAKLLSNGYRGKVLQGGKKVILSPEKLIVDIVDMLDNL